MFTLSRSKAPIGKNVSRLSLTLMTIAAMTFSASPSNAQDYNKAFDGLYGGVEFGYDFSGAELYGSHYYDSYYGEHFNEWVVEGGTGYYGLTVGVRHQTRSGLVVGFEGRTGYGFENTYLIITDEHLDFGNNYWNPQKQTSFDLIIGKVVGKNVLLYGRMGSGKQNIEYEDWSWDGDTYFGTFDYLEHTKRYGIGIEGKISRNLSLRFDMTNSHYDFDQRNTQYNIGMLVKF